MAKSPSWSGSPPCCEISSLHELHGTFIDGKTQFGPWAMMCPECHTAYGCGLGLGLGQKYTRQPDGSWLKVEG